MQTPPGEKTGGRAVASLGPAGASAPFAASPPLREAVMVTGRTCALGNRARLEQSPGSASCLPRIDSMGASSRSRRSVTATDSQTDEIMPQRGARTRRNRGSLGEAGRMDRDGQRTARLSELTPTDASAIRLRAVPPGVFFKLVCGSSRRVCGRSHRFLSTSKADVPRCIQHLGRELTDPVLANDPPKPTLCQGRIELFIFVYVATQHGHQFVIGFGREHIELIQWISPVQL
jgi:hypothetical protein